MSLDTIELIVNIEKEFNIRVNDEIRGGCSTVQNALDIVWEHCDHKIYASKEEVAIQLKKVIIENTGIPESIYGLNKSFTNDFGID